MPKPVPCLHCTIREAINDWAEPYAPQHGAAKQLNVADVIDGLTEVLAEFIEAPDDRNHRRRALKRAHAALDAGVRAVRTGEPQSLDPMATEH